MDFAKYYFDPSFPGSYSGLSSFKKSLKDKNIKFDQNDLKKWILDQEEYTIHKPLRKNSIRHS